MKKYICNILILLALLIFPSVTFGGSYELYSSESTSKTCQKGDLNCRITAVVRAVNSTGQTLTGVYMWTSGSGLTFSDAQGNQTGSMTQVSSREVPPGNEGANVLVIFSPTDIQRTGTYQATLYADGRTCKPTTPPDCYAYGGGSIGFSITIEDVAPTAPFTPTPTQKIIAPTLTPTPTTTKVAQSAVQVSITPTVSSTPIPTRTPTTVPVSSPSTAKTAESNESEQRSESSSPQSVTPSPIPTESNSIVTKIFSEFLSKNDNEGVQQAPVEDTPEVITELKEDEPAKSSFIARLLQKIEQFFNSIRFRTSS